MSLDALGEVFMKTLGFYCALRESGCYFDEKLRETGDDSGSSVDDSLPSETTPAAANSTISLIAILKDSRSFRADSKSKCTGSLHLEKDRYGHHFVQ